VPSHIGDIRSLGQQPVGVAELAVISSGVCLRRAIRGPHDLHALSGQALELLELAFVKLEPSDALKLTHCSGLQTPA
jgi:hypothetical protein